MKKFLPKSVNNPQGFTLVELLVVITIIAILSVIGMAVFGNIQARARDARRRADIDAISKAYEVVYNPDQLINEAYRVLEPADFQDGKIPLTPEGVNYTGLLPAAANTYKVCATLEGGIAGCSSTSTTCYCKSAAQAGTTGIAVPCSTTITAGSSCKAVGVAVNTTAYFCPATSIDCSAGTTANRNTVLYSGNYYSIAGGGAPVGTINVYKTNTTLTNPAPVSVTATIRTTNP